MSNFLNLTTLLGIRVAVNLDQVKAFVQVNDLNRLQHSYQENPRLIEYTLVDLGDEVPLKVRESFEQVGELISRASRQNLTIEERFEEDES